ncbi:Glucose-1-phosphate adenylyltransferase [Thalassoglobus neptunius]|uniref:Glucose-1-phosphate adenylyltransferase n=1 Tax=Thalassoglobus neptunius TaxID=1938619 RepID=A0A5C5X259_9PLAN|nr:glucose-1-phosphate adenylyltransferase [Thalassoglobus neptunius]TWT56918.1 Glucose-1-phosphate adenylyltransferase [Thalassoglobus neptunius]
MNNVVCFVLGGGKGTRLQPLTSERSKPAVPIGGKYRLIDIPISNCINSGIRRTYLLTQFNSVSLHRHVRQTYNFDPFNGGFVEILAAQQTNDGADWYQGTADAVRKQVRYLQQSDIEYVLILSGDQLYRMNFREMLDVHKSNNADVTIATLPIDQEKAASFGITRLDENGRVCGFLEKPQSQQELDHVKTSPDWIDQQGIESNGREYLASMGIYLFNRDTLVDALLKTDYEDFGREVFPASIRAKHVQAYLFDGYWEDIGTIKAFYESQLEMASSTPPFEMHKAESPIYTRPRFLPSTRIDNAEIKESLISDGCVIEGTSKITHSLIGLRSYIGKNATITGVVLMGADFYPRDPRGATKNAADPPIGIGEGTIIEGAIVDKNCRIGKQVVIRKPSGCPEDGRCGPVIVRDGVIVVPRGTILPDGWKLDNVEPCKF